MTGLLRPVTVTYTCVTYGSLFQAAFGLGTLSLFDIGRACRVPPM